MARAQLSLKRIAIDKAQGTLLVAVSVAVFVSIFSLVGIKALIGQASYQSKVIKKQEKARDQMKKNLVEAKKLNTTYQEFANTPENILGGNPNGSGDHDGENARIVLDALPGKYDFPALATSVEKMLKDNNIALSSLTGTDDEVSQSAAKNTDTPKAVEIPFSVEADVSSQNASNFVSLFERSIRPMQVKKITVNGNQDQLKVALDMKTFYQPDTIFTVRKEVVKTSGSKTPAKSKGATKR